MNRWMMKRDNLGQALMRLKESIIVYQDQDENTVIRDGVIQRFEFTAELAWKATREYLLDQGYSDINSPKATMRAAFADGIITDEAVWLMILNDRNATSHLYSDAKATEICKRICTAYVDVFEALMSQLTQS
jgi:nucleotidyltransferase substrate binding protein (TIGR01987 family)